MEPEKMKQLEAKLKSLFEESNKEPEVMTEQPRPQEVNNNVVIRRRNGVSQKLVS